MINIEQVEKLRAYGNISFEDAKRALETAGGNMLDAVILLEREGKVAQPQASGSFTPPKQPSDNREQANENNYYKHRNENGNFSTHVKRFARWCGQIIRRGNINTFEVTKNGEEIINIPVTILVVLLIFFFWIIVPLLVAGLFFDFHYAFHGPDLGKDSVNNVVNSMANAADNIKNSVKEAANENGERHDSDNRR